MYIHLSTNSTKSPIYQGHISFGLFRVGWISWTAPCATLTCNEYMFHMVPTGKAYPACPAMAADRLLPLRRRSVNCVAIAPLGRATCLSSPTCTSRSTPHTSSSSQHQAFPHTVPLSPLVRFSASQLSSLQAPQELSTSRQKPLARILPI